MEADMVAGIIRKRGLIFNETAKPAKIGSRICVVAVLEIHIDKKAVASIKPSSIFNGLVPVNIKDAYCNTPMQVPALHGNGHNKTTHKKKNNIIEINGRNRFAIHNAEQRI